MYFYLYVHVPGIIIRYRDAQPWAHRILDQPAKAQVSRHRPVRRFF